MLKSSFSLNIPNKNLSKLKVYEKNAGCWMLGLDFGIFWALFVYILTNKRAVFIKFSRFQVSVLIETATVIITVKSNGASERGTASLNRGILTANKQTNKRH